ncbi:MAG: hypothetical protein JWO36_1378 [Myxococcales bacterium]|nr:hypothetical protein [Myxococcales bacterium]
MRRLLLCVLIGASACGGGNVSDLDASVADTAPGDGGLDPNDGARSGSRLKLTWFVFADGSRQLDGLYDAQRKESCFIYPNWADGNAYCTPDFGGTIVYTSASCTTKVAQVYRDPSCARPPPTYLLDYSTSTCSYQPAHLYTRGAPTSVAQYWYKNANGSCSGPFTGASYDFYSVGGEVSLIDLVKLTVSSPVGAQRFGQRYYQSSDGMRRPGPIHDAMLGVDCYPNVYADPTVATCVPSGAGYASYDHDAACTQPELGIQTSCPKPTYTEYYDGNACPSTAPRYYTTGNAVSGTPLYFQSGSSCVATTPTANTTYYQVGAQLSLATLQLETDNAANRRLQLVHYTTTDGVRARDYALYDSAKTVQCYPTTMPDGTIRCFPSGGYASTYYANSACTQQIDLVDLYGGPSSCGSPPVPKYASKTITPPPGSCAYSSETHLITTPYTGPIYTNYGSCQPFTPTNTRMYNVGPALPMTDFVSGNVFTDP